MGQEKKISGGVSTERDPAFRGRSVGHFVSRMRHIRMRRNELLGAPLFRDPAWDVLLFLFEAHERGCQVSVSWLCRASGVPTTTVLNKISKLEEYGLVEIELDPFDRRRSYVTPTAKAIQGVHETVTSILEEWRNVDPAESADSTDPDMGSDARVRERGTTR